MFIILFHLTFCILFLAAKSSLSAIGLLPTPEKSMMLIPPSDSKGIFDPNVIQPGFVVDAQEIWVNEKFSSDDMQYPDSRLKKRGRKPDGPQRHRFHNDEATSERGFQHIKEEFHEKQMEPPEKRQIVQPPMQPGMHGPSPRSINESARMRQAPPQFRARASSNSENFSQFRPPASFQSKSGPTEELSVNMADNESDFNETNWNESQGFNAVNRRGMSGPRGRGRGFAHPSMSRDISMPRDNQYFVDEEGNRMPPDQHMEQQWRSRGRPNMEENNIDEQEVEPDWNNPNFIPHPRRGPHPLLLRGHHLSGPRRFPAPSESRGMHHDGGGPPPVRQGPSQRPPHPRHQTHEGQEGSHIPEQTRPPNARPYPKLRGLMDEIMRPSKEQWQGDRTGMGR